jgi:hypothetical protein
MLSRLSRAVLLAILLAPAMPALAVTDADTVRPWVDDNELVKEGEVELARQIDLRRQELQQVKALHTQMRDALAENVQRLKELHDRDLAVATLFVSAAPALKPSDGEQSFVPHIGWGIFGFFEKHRDDTNKAIQEADGAVARGETQFSIPGIGWISGQGLDALIASDQHAIDVLQAAADAGTYQIAFPGIGWVDRNGLQARRAANDQAIATAMATIAKGEYQVHVPHLGWVTRNAVEAQIAQLEAEMKGLEGSKSAGTLQIHRAIGGWITLVSTQATMDGFTAEADAIAAKLASGDYQLHLPGIGWVNGKAVDDLVKARQADLAKMIQTAAEGHYTVPSGCCGWVDQETVTRLLALPDCRPQGPTPCLPEGHRASLQDALRRIPVAVDVDAQVRQMEIDLYLLWRGLLDQLARPRLQQLDLALQQWARTQSEFDIELAQHRHRIERRIKWLREVIDTQIP